MYLFRDSQLDLSSVMSPLQTSHFAHKSVVTLKLLKISYVEWFQQESNPPTL